MTRKDYIAIAGAIAAAEEVNEMVSDEAGIAASTLRLVVAEIAGVLRADNPRFDQARFEMAALPIEHKRRADAIKAHFAS